MSRCEEAAFGSQWKSESHGARADEAAPTCPPHSRVPLTQTQRGSRHARTGACWLRVLARPRRGLRPYSRPHRRQLWFGADLLLWRREPSCARDGVSEPRGAPPGAPSPSWVSFLAGTVGHLSLSARSLGSPSNAASVPGAGRAAQGGSCGDGNPGPGLRADWPRGSELCTVSDTRSLQVAPSRCWPASTKPLASVGRTALSRGNQAHGPDGRKRRLRGTFQLCPRQALR